MKRISAVLAAALLPLVISSCGRQLSTGDPAAFAKGWVKFETPHFILLDPPDSPRLDHLEGLGAACEDVFSQLSQILKLDVQERIWVYRFVTNQDCEEKTGHSAGHVEGYRIYTRIGAPLGGAIALAALTSVGPNGHIPDLIRNGLREAFDQQDLNVHREVASLHATDRWIPLSEFVSGQPAGDHEAFDLESASFVAYLIQRHGVEKFKKLWSSRINLAESLRKTYGGSIEQIEEDWVAHMTREANKT